MSPPTKKAKNVLFFREKFDQLNSGKWELEAGVVLPVVKLQGGKGTFMQAYALASIQAPFTLGSQRFTPFVPSPPVATSNGDLAIRASSPMQTSGLPHLQLFLRSLIDQPGIPPKPTQVLVKAYHREKKELDHVALFEKYMSNSLSQYRKIKEKFPQLPVAEIYNEKTALTQGVFIVEYIPDSIEPSSLNHLSQIQRFFDCAVEHQESFDLKPDNFRVKKTTLKEKFSNNGVEVEIETHEETVKLIDFMEETNEDEFFCNLTQTLGQWVEAWRSRGKTEEEIQKLYTFLTANVRTLNPKLPLDLHPPASLTAFIVESSQVLEKADEPVAHDSNDSMQVDTALPLPAAHSDHLSLLSHPHASDS